MKKHLSSIVWKEVSSLAEYENSLTPFPQTELYASVRERTGFSPKRFVATDEAGNLLASILLVNSTTTIFGKEFWYAPYGPVLLKEVEGLFTSLANFLNDFTSKNNAIFTRIDLTGESAIKDEALSRSSFLKASKSSSVGVLFQPRFEEVVSLVETEEHMLSRMSQSTRRSLRLAEKSGVEIRVVTPNNMSSYFDIFYSLLEETSKRNSFSLHGKDYYYTLCTEIVKTGKGFFVLGLKDNQVMVADLVAYFGDEAFFVHGGSKTGYKDTGASYAVKWEAIKQSKQDGKKYFNLGGIGESGSSLDSLTVFKKKFGGYTREHSPLLDVVVDKPRYIAYILYKFVKKNL